MKQSSNSLFWGVILLAFGLLLLVKKLGWFHIDWGQTLQFWPLLLIAAGVSLLLRQSWSGVLTAMLIAVAIPAAIVNGSHKKLQYLEEEGITLDWDDEEDQESDKSSEEAYDERSKTYSSDGETEFSEPFVAGTTEATFNFGAGAGRFTIDGTTDQLVAATAESEWGQYVMTNKRKDSQKSTYVSLEMEGKDSTRVRLRDFNDSRNRVNVQLNANPAWNFDIGLGAGKGDFDLTRYKVKSVKLGAGAADIKLKLGSDILNNANIDIEAGVASIKIDIPEEVGCELMIDGALNARDFDNFEKINDGLYRTPNYESAKKKIKVSYEGGLSKIEVNRN